jgi:hypothetical protein
MARIKVAMATVKVALLSDEEGTGAKKYAASVHPWNTRALLEYSQQRFCCSSIPSSAAVQWTMTAYICIPNPINPKNKKTNINIIIYVYIKILSMPGMN